MNRRARTAKTGRRFGGGRSASLALALLVALGAAAVAKSTLLVTNVARGGAPARPPPALDNRPASSEPRARLPEPGAGPADTDVDGAEGEAGAASNGPEDAPRARPAGENDLSPTERRILQQLAERRTALDERERQLDLRAEMLETAEAKVAEQLARLERLRAEIAGAVEEHEAEETAKIACLVKIYQSMRPKAAAAIFNRLDMSVLLEVVARMSETKSSAVIARMEPARARGS